MISSSHLRDVITAYLGRHPAEQPMLAPVLEQLDQGADLTDRRRWQGHVTVSGLVLNPDDQVLQILHRVFNLYIPPGGHLEPGDKTLPEAAEREISEEAGLPEASLALVDDVPLRIDVHPIAANPVKNEDEHHHIDLCYLFRTDHHALRPQLEEVHEARWADPTELGNPVERARVRAFISTGKTAGLGRQVTGFDIDAYHERAQSGPCFVCRMLAGDPGYVHRIVYDDGDYVAFLDKHPTLYGKLLVTPRAHVEDTIGGFTEDAYLALQRVVHQVAGALARVVDTERMYVMSLGSNQGNAHVHWHIAPLPPGVPYPEQQFYALDWSTRGRLDLSEAEADELASRLRAELRRPAAAAGESA